MNYGADFGYSGSFHLFKVDVDEILNNVRNGLTVEEAVEDWTCGLDDSDYYIVQKYVKDRIVEYIEQIVEDD